MVMICSSRQCARSSGNRIFFIQCENTGKIQRWQAGAQAYSGEYVKLQSDKMVWYSSCMEAQLQATVIRLYMTDNPSALIQITRPVGVATSDCKALT